MREADQKHGIPLTLALINNQQQSRYLLNTGVLLNNHYQHLLYYNNLSIFPSKDAGSVFDTEDVQEFLAMIAGLTAGGGGDTPDPSIGAIIRAVEASEPGSPIYVFTDAPASDEHRLNEAKSLILKKNVRLSFAFVNSAVRKRSVNEKYRIKSHTKRQVGTTGIYESLAAYSGGQFFNVRTDEISDLASLVSFSAVQSHNTIFRRSNVLQGTVEHSFSIDSSLVEVTISINGEMINASVSTPQGQL